MTNSELEKMGFKYFVCSDNKVGGYDISYDRLKAGVEGAKEILKEMDEGSMWVDFDEDVDRVNMSLDKLRKFLGETND